MGAERGADGGAVHGAAGAVDVIEARVDGAGLAMWLRTVDRICRGRVGEGTWTFADGGLTVEWSGIHNSFPGALPDHGGGQGVAMVEPDQMRSLAQDCPRLPGLLVQAGAARIRLGAVEVAAQVEIEAAAERALFVLEERPPEPAPDPAPDPALQAGSPPRRTRKRAALEALSLLPGRSGSAEVAGDAPGDAPGEPAGDLRSGATGDLRSVVTDDLRSDVTGDLRSDVTGDLRSGAAGGPVVADAQGPVRAEPVAEARPVEVPPTALLPLFSALPAPDPAALAEGEPKGTVIELQPWALPENALMARGAPLSEVLALRWRYDGATLGRAGVARAVAAAHRQKEHLIGQAAALLEPLGVPPEVLERWVEAHLEARATGRESFSIGNVVYIDKKSRQVKLFGN